MILAGTRKKDAELADDSMLPRAAAAGSLVASACLLMTGKRKSALAAVAMAGAIMALEQPEAVRRCWQSIPQYLRRGQDFLAKVDDVVEEISAQGERLRQSLGRD